MNANLGVASPATSEPHRRSGPIHLIRRVLAMFALIPDSLIAALGLGTFALIRRRA